MLDNCLASLTSQIVPENCTIDIVVVENDAMEKSRTVVEKYRLAGHRIHYYLETQRGIPFARNRTLNIAEQFGFDWIALIDDDERASSNWIEEFYSVANSFEADVVYGAVEKSYEKAPPSWWPIDRPLAEATGHALDRASTNNVFFSSRLIAKDKSGLRFAPELTSGYEDLDFFERAHELGHRIVWAPKATVEEDVPASRVTPERLVGLTRSCAAAHTQVHSLRRGKVSAKLRFIPKSIRRIIGGSVICLYAKILTFADREKADHIYHRGLLRLHRGLGNFEGLFRRRSNYYSTIDGY